MFAHHRSARKPVGTRQSLSARAMRTMRTMRLLTLALLLTLLVPLVAAPSNALAAGPSCTVAASGGTYTTIQAAVNDSGCTTIDVAAGTYTENVTINHNVTINGATTGTTTVDGNHAGSVFVIWSGTVSLANLTIQHGSGSTNTGGYLYGGGIENFGTLTVQNSTFTNNRADNGGGVVNTGTLTVQNSTLSGNSATYGGGILNYGTLAVSNSTLSGNSATAGGGILNYGPLAVSNSTLKGNSATFTGTNIFNQGKQTLLNTIVANSEWGTCQNNSDGTTTSRNSLFEATRNGCGVSNGMDGNIVGQDPKLGPLADNGGPTQTFALLAGSPAIDAGDDAACAVDPVNGLDQRGIARPKGAHCDIGAYEANPTVKPLVNVRFTANGQNGWFTTNPAPGSVTAAGLASITSITCTGATVSNLTGVNTASARATLAVTGEGFHTIACRATDSAEQSGYGDGSQNSATVKIDVTQPTISAAATSAPNANGWYTSPVTIHFTCSDTGSSVAAGACPADQVLTTDGAAVSSTAQTVTDAAGNTSAPSNVVTVKLDTIKPTLNPVVSPNPVLLKGSATASPNASDATSGIATQSCGALDTSSVGTKTVQCTATDAAGNTSSASASYQVIYKWTGFLQPVDNTPTLNVVKAGSAVPVTFSLGGNQGLSIFAAGSPAAQQITCDSGAPVDDIEQTVTAGASSLQYDAASDTYTYVWKTDKAWTNTCRQLRVTLNDGTVHTANFTFK